MAISVPVDIDLQIKKAIEDTNELVAGVNKSLGGIEKQAKSAGFAINGIAFVELTRAAIDFGKTIVGVFEKAIAEAIDADAAVQGLSSSLKSAGDFSEKNVEAFEGLAKALAEVSRFSDEAVLGAFRIGKQFGLTNKETARFGKAAVELASFLGQDLDTTARQLGQTFDGTAGRLAEQVPQLRNLSAAALQAGGALGVVLKVAGGSALRDLERFDVQIIKLKQAFGDIFEELGTSIVKNPAVINSLKIIAKLFSEIASAVSDNDETFRAFIGGSLAALVKGFYIVSQVVDSVNSGFYNIAKFLEPAVQLLESFGKATEALKKGDVRAFAKSLDIVTATRDRFKEIDKLAERDAKVFDKFNTALAEVQGAIDRAAVSQKKFNKDVKAGFDDSKPTIGRKIEREMEAAAAEYYKLKEQIDKDARERIAGIVQNPIKALASNKENTLKLDIKTQEATAAMVGIVTNVLQGRQGAVNLIAAGAEAAGRFFLGIPGFGELAKLLTQGPDEIRAAVRSFAESLPEVVITIAENIPIIFETLAEKIPDIIEKIVERADRIVLALAKSMPIVAIALSKAFLEVVKRVGSAILQGAGTFIRELIAGAGKFISELVSKIGEALQRLVDNINPVKDVGSPSGLLGAASNPFGGLQDSLGPVGGAIMNPVGSISGAIGGAIGGIFGKSGFAGGGGGSSQPTVVKVQIGQRDLATAILDLNRQGFRTT